MVNGHPAFADASAGEAVIEETAIRLRQGFERLRQSFSVGARTKTATAKASADKDRQPSTVNQKKASRLKDA